MEEDSPHLLARMVTHSQPPAPGRYDLKRTLQQLNISSVFDIAQLSETEFAERLGQYNDDDPAPVHRKARSAAAQLEALFREQQVSPAAPDAKRESGVTYSALFKENWPQFCASTSIAAVDSPVAYLRALYLFAQQLEKNAHGTTAVTLAKRRPDLGGLLIEPHSVLGQRPMLSIINQTLLDNLAKGDHKKAYTLLSVTRYPFALPYHFHHHQCLLGLTANKLLLGELNYRISRKLPVTGPDARAYGQAVADHDDAQPLLSGLSPQQQALLTQPLVGPTTDRQQLKDFYRDNYHWVAAPRPTGPEHVADFLRHTGLNAEQLQVLLAQNTHKPRRSSYCNEPPDPAYGAGYINGPDGTAIDLDDTSASRLLNVTAERFDRLQRMIRLQRWLNIPFAELDTLLIGSMRCEGAANPSRLINHTTLRALGVYRYLNKRYGLQADEFAAVLHQLPVDAAGEHVSLFDRVFNRIDSALPALCLDGKPFDATTRQQLCAALGLQDSPNSLQLLISADEHPNRSVATVSGVYRQARIARLFGLSIRACRQLLHLLQPGENLQQQLLDPTLRSSLKGSLDVLDVLMQLDWASRWIKDSGSSLALLRHQLLLEPVSLDPAVGLLVKAYTSQPQRPLSDRFKHHSLLVQPGDEQPRLPPIDWEAATRDVLLQVRQGKSLSLALDDVLATLELSTQSARAPMLVKQARDALLPILDSLKVDAWGLYLNLKQTLLDLPHAQGDHENYQKYEENDQFLRLYASQSPLQSLGYLVLLLPHAADLLQLPISRQALHQFLVNPHWLNEAYHRHSLLDLTLHNVFLMQQFKHCIDHCGVSEEQLLDYLKHANDGAGAEPLSSHEADSHLARLLGWNASEINVLSRTLQPARITCVERLDWILRCRQACTDTGLSAAQLLDVCRLNNRSTFDEWRAMGEAVTSTHP